MYGSLRIYIFAISDYDVSSFKFLIGDLGKQVSSSKIFTKIFGVENIMCKNIVLSIFSTSTIKHRDRDQEVYS